MPRTSVRKELWVINPRAINSTKKPPKRTICSASPVSPEAGSRRWDQESFKKFKEKPEDPAPGDKKDLQLGAEKMPVETRSKSKEEEQEEQDVLNISSDSSVEMVLTERKKKLAEPKVRRRGRPRKVPGEKSEENKESKMKKSKVKQMKTPVKNKAKLSRKPSEEEPLQEEDSSNKPGKEDEEDHEREEFEKNLKHDVNFVLAKHVVDKKMAFDVDKNKNLSGFRKKMMSAIRRADILTLRKSLEGGDVHVPKDLVMPSSAAPAVPREIPPPILLSNENSPDVSVSELVIDQDAPQMPVIFPQQKEPRREPQKVSGEIEKAKPKEKILLKPLNFFPSIKKTSFKIPRKEGEKARQKKAPRGKVNGALWRWALGVDDNGQSRR